MTPAEKIYFFDRLISDGLHNPLYASGAGGAELHFHCPIRDHEHDSDRKTAFRVNADKQLWHCFKCGRGGSPFQLAEATLGSRNAALGMYRAVKKRSGNGGLRLKLPTRKRFVERRREAAANPPRIETGDVAIFLRLDALVKYNQLKDESCFCAVQQHPVEWAGEEWLGFPTLTPGSWKLLGFDWDGRIRRENGSIQKRNVGPVSIVASDKLREALDSRKPIPTLYDVEGEGDLLCAIEHGLDPVLTSTGGAGTTKGHEHCRDLLNQLDIGEVQIVRDNDETGRHGAKITTQFWDSLGVTNRVIELPPEVGDGGDLRDYFALLEGGKSRHEGRAA
jgi:hypothetical protein